MWVSNRPAQLRQQRILRVKTNEHRRAPGGIRTEPFPLGIEFNAFGAGTCCIGEPVRFERPGDVTAILLCFLYLATANSPQQQLQRI